MEFTKQFIKAALIRAIKTAAQTALGMITVGSAFNEINWAAVASVSGVAALLSILTSIATGIPEAKNDGEVLLNEAGEMTKIQLNKEIEDVKAGSKFVLNIKQETQEEDK